MSAAPKTEIQIPRILITGPSLVSSRNVSGVSSVVRQILSVLAPTLELTHLEVGAEERRRFGKIGSLGKIARAISRLLTEEYDVLHSNTAFNTKSIFRDLMLMTIARARGKRVLLHVHGGTYVQELPPPVIGWGIARLMHIASVIVVLSKTERRILGERYPKYKSKIQYIYNGIVQTSHRRSVNINSKLEVIYLGRLVPEKGIEILLKSLSEAEGIARLSVYGSGALLDMVQQYASAFSNIRYKGIFEPHAGQEILQNFDVLVLPSTQGEGMPMAIVEAMSTGVVPICTPISSIPEIIENGKNGYLVEVGSAQVITEALRTLATKPQHLEAMSAEALAFAKANFDATINFTKFGELYAETST